MRLHDRARLGRRKDAARHAAFTELHREHARNVYNLALRLVGNREEAQDISQDVLLKAFERLGEPGELNRRAWLYRVTVNACYDHLRSRRRRPRVADEAPEPASKVDGYEQAELARSVEATLLRLPPAQRAALLLREVHGLPTGEVACILGTTPDSAAVTLSRARKTFRSHYGKAGALTAGLALPHLRLPQMPLPASLDASSVITAASGSTGAAASVNCEAAMGIVARLADVLSTKAGMVGASATLITGGIGGALAVETAVRTPAPDPRPSQLVAVPRSVASSGAHQTVVNQPKGSSRPTASESANPAPATAESALPPESPGTPSTSPTTMTIGETADPSAAPTPEPTPSTDPATSAAPTPEPSGSPLEPAPSPSSAP